MGIFDALFFDLQVTVRLEAPHQYTSHYVEIIGVVQQDRSIVQQMATDLGDKFGT